MCRLVTANVTPPTSKAANDTKACDGVTAGGGGEAPLPRGEGSVRGNCRSLVGRLWFHGPPPLLLNLSARPGRVVLVLF